MARLGLYQPFIEDRNIRRLYRLKVDYRERTGRKVPMTALVNRILDDFFQTSAADVDEEYALASDLPAPHTSVTARCP